MAVKKPPRPRRPDAPSPDSINPVTGKRYAGERCAARTPLHARAAVRSFYEYHREMHGRPLLNPFPKAKRAEDEHFAPGCAGRGLRPLHDPVMVELEEDEDRDGDGGGR